ncbi:heavy metal translocating P-type ATPase, partial [Campylobacter jejuni]|nr:heavy metal translocating P-type ATPase [Campylobacter jejuni]
RLIESIGYKASAYDASKASKKADLLKREFYSKLVVAIACVMNIMWIAVAKYAGFFSGMDKDTKDILNFAEFILCSPVLFYTGSHFYKSAFKTLKMHSLNMDVLVISGASLAYVYSLWA